VFHVVVFLQVLELYTYRNGEVKYGNFIGDNQRFINLKVYSNGNCLL
jgi:hypothetical protein